MIVRGVLERVELGGIVSFVVRTDDGRSVELLAAPASATALLGRAVSVRGALAPEQFGVTMVGPRLTVTSIEPIH